MSWQLQSNKENILVYTDKPVNLSEINHLKYEMNKLKTKKDDGAIFTRSTANIFFTALLFTLFLSLDFLDLIKGNVRQQIIAKSSVTVAIILSLIIIFIVDKRSHSGS